SLNVPGPISIVSPLDAFVTAVAIVGSPVALAGQFEMVIFGTHSVPAAATAGRASASATASNAIPLRTMAGYYALTTPLQGGQMRRLLILSAAAATALVATSAASTPKPPKVVTAHKITRPTGTLKPGSTVSSSSLGPRTFVNGHGDGFALANTRQAQYP